MPENEDNTTPNQTKAKTSLRIDNIFMIKHIDFIEIVGAENNVMIIGFRQSQTEFDLEGTGQSTAMGHHDQTSC